MQVIGGLNHQFHLAQAVGYNLQTVLSSLWHETPIGILDLSDYSQSNPTEDKDYSARESLICLYALLKFDLRSNSVLIDSFVAPR